tara:strand:+ start:466172 stop:466318 length:147 start_codon:yes stop_codon:yes gene_type:complete
MGKFIFGFIILTLAIGFTWLAMTQPKITPVAMEESINTQRFLDAQKQG